MAKNPSQTGANAVWGGPLSEEGRATLPGNSRYGKNCMQVLKAPYDYKAGPISSLAK